VLSEASGNLYDVAGDPHLAEALMTPREAASATAIARELRAEVLAGAYDETGRMPSRAQLKARYKISLENASVVLRLLAAEGWVTLEQGRGTYLRARHQFGVGIEIPTAASGTGRDYRRDGTLAAEGRLLAAVTAAAEAEPAVYSVGHAKLHGDGAHIGLGICAASSARAVLIAESLIESVGDDEWSWEGWDLALAEVTARPA